MINLRYISCIITLEFVKYFFKKKKKYFFHTFSVIYFVFSKIYFQFPNLTLFLHFSQ